MFQGGTFAISLMFSHSVPLLGHFGKTPGTSQGHSKCSQFSGFLNIANVPPWNIFGTSFWFILNFPGWEHHSHTTGNTAKYTVNEPLGNIMSTFFGKILGLPTDYLIGTLWSHDLGNWEHTEQFFQNEPLRNIVGTFFGKTLGFPIDYLIGTLQSHDLEHYECTGHFLHWEHCNEIGWENSKCACYIPGGNWVGSLSISLQCTCNVPARHTTPCPQCLEVHSILR